MFGPQILEPVILGGSIKGKRMNLVSSILKKRAKEITEVFYNPTRILFVVREN